MDEKSECLYIESWMKINFYEGLIWQLMAFIIWIYLVSKKRKCTISNLRFLLFFISACYRVSSCTASMLFVVKYQFFVCFGFYLRLLCYILLKNEEIEYAFKCWNLVSLFVLFDILNNGISFRPANRIFFYFTIWPKLEAIFHFDFYFKNLIFKGFLSPTHLAID